MTLKTLKDFKICASQEILKSILKAEALKWVKSLEHPNSPDQPEGKASGWIMNFFNITEEDLE